MTQSSSSQNIALIAHISSQVGQRTTVDTLTCSHPSPSLAIAIIASVRFAAGDAGKMNLPLFPNDASEANGPERSRYFSGT
jgi:hypothetical protein